MQLNATHTARFKLIESHPYLYYLICFLQCLLQGFKEKKEAINEKNKWKKRLKKTKKRIFQRSATHKGSKIIQLMHRTIHHFFPDLLQSIKTHIQDPRKKASQYSISEIITACIMMSVFKEGSRHAMNQTRSEDQFKENYFKIFRQRLPHMDTINNVMKKIKEHELERLKKSLIQSLLEKKVLHKFKFFGRYFGVAVDGTGVHKFDKKPEDGQCL